MASRWGKDGSILAAQIPAKPVADLPVPINEAGLLLHRNFPSCFSGKLIESQGVKINCYVFA